ncbi:DbpA RNA binding domain protein [Clostridium carboxidivorans P7]|nr:DbpA RNA binding domain protein [Clostridium carboxidivorans P7]
MLKDVKNTLEQNDYKDFIPVATGLDDDYNLVDVAAALMKMLFDREFNFDYNEDSPVKSTKPVRLFLSVGRIDKVTPVKILNFLEETSDIDVNEVGDIDIFDKFTFIDLPEDLLDAVLSRSSGKRLNGRKVNIEVAKSKNNHSHK